MPAQAAPAQTTNLFLLEDLDDVSRTSELAEGDLDALRSIADWIKTYILEPHKDLIGRGGPVCPYLAGSLERKTLWLAPEHVPDGGAPQVVELMDGYKRRLQEAEPTDGDVNYNVIAVVFTDLRADRAQRAFADVFQQLAVRSYVEGWSPVRAVLRRQRGDCDLQLELPTIRIARAVSLREVWGRR
jgi:hypothetical protein